MFTRKPTATILALAIPAAIAAVPVLPTGPTAGTSAAAEVAIDHWADVLGADDLAGAIVTDEYTSAHNGVTHVYLRQALSGIEVLGADATVNIKDGAVLHTAGRLIDDVADVASGVRRLGAADAVAVGALTTGTTPADLDGAAGLAYQVTQDGRVRLAWSFQLVAGDDWWNLSVDAETGEVLYLANWVDHEEVHEITDGIARTTANDATGGIAAPVDPILPVEQLEDGSSYRVFAMPLESPIDNGAEHAIVENPADAAASPFGWHDTDGAAGPEFTHTRGNNVHAYTDHVGGAGLGSFYSAITSPNGGEGLDFHDEIATYDATPAAYVNAAVTNLFYWNNVMHDVTYRYGFTEAAGNFQATNYTGAGVGGDAVNAEAQDGGGALNANFATPADGGAGRMQMYLWADTGAGGDGTQQVRDGDLESGIIAHEYGHGISNRLVGGPSNVDCLRSHDERQGEGWSDFWSFALTMRAGDDGATPRGIGNYVLYNDRFAAGEPDPLGYGGDARTGPGIRITPYSTSPLVNPSTYDTVKGAAEPHGVGYVWASMLWDLYWNLTDVHGFNPNPYDSWDTGGNNLAIQLTVDGMKFAPCEPGFADARDAIIAADAALTDGENFCIIWDTFADRGLGFDADQGDPASKIDGSNGFESHPDC